MRVAIFTEGSSKIGLGHVSRCQSLMQAFEAYKCDVRMFVDGDESVLAFAGDRNIFLQKWTKKDSSVSVNFDIAVIDSYLAEIDVYARIGDSAKILLCLDDFNRLKYPKSFVLNGALAAKELGYVELQDSHYLLGAEYSLMRRPFWEMKEKVIHESVSDILVTFGGEDIRNLTPLALDVCTSVFPNARIHAIIGQAMQSIRNIPLNVQIHTSLAAVEMKALMEQCDLWVGAGGMTLFELAVTGVPGVAIEVAKNQRSNLKGFMDAGFLDSCLTYDDPDLARKLLDSLSLLSSRKKRQSLSNAGQKAIDGKGALNVVREILKFSEEDS